MKQFLIILRHEFTGYLKNKIFVGVTVFLMVVIAAVLFFPRIKEAFGGGEGGQETVQPQPEPAGPGSASEQSGELSAPSGPVLLLAGNYSEGTEDVLAYGFDYQVQKGGWSTEEIREKIRNGEAECALVFDQPDHYTYYVDDLGMYDDSGYMLDEGLANMLQMQALMEKGLSADDAAALLTLTVTHETELLGKDQMSNFFYTYAMIFGLYMVILLYGQMVASSVASEKSSRAMELLITSADPTALMFGKVIAACLAGLLQLVCIFGSALLFFRLNEAYWSGSSIVLSLFSIPTGLFLYMLLFFILGFFLYAFLYGAVGSTVTKLEDINTSVMPITMVFLISFMIVIFSMTSGNVDSPMMKAASFIPFTSPMAMFTRIGMSTVPGHEIAVSVALLVLSVIGIGVLAARIYRLGVLMYGKPPKIGELIKMAARK